MGRPALSSPRGPFRSSRRKSTGSKTNWLMRKRNIRTLPTKWTRLSPNFPDFNFPESELITNNNEQSYLLYFCYALESIYGGREVAVGRTDNKKSHLTTPETDHCPSPLLLAHVNSCS